MHYSILSGSLTGFHSGMSLKTEKGCLPRSPSPGTYTKGVLWSAQNQLYWFCERLSILLTLKSPIFHFSRHCNSSLDKGLFYSRQCWMTEVEVDWSWVCKAQCLWMRDSCMTWEFAKRYTFCACRNLSTIIADKDWIFPLIWQVTVFLKFITKHCLDERV